MGGQERRTLLLYMIDLMNIAFLLKQFTIGIWKPVSLTLALQSTIAIP